MENIKLIITIYLFLILLSFTTAIAIHFLVGYFNYTFGVLLFISSLFVGYLFFFETKDNK